MPLDLLPQRRTRKNRNEGSVFWKAAPLSNVSLKAEDILTPEEVCGALESARFLGLRKDPLALSEPHPMPAHRTLHTL